ncbi:hypothetical protein [Thermosynechococcus vestitus]|uniref:Tlr0318 protein n=1 Tax=Thermosynechococcus vestitus (strain NIES-2133 / IAM M-273 / BP-1) TaxID=197221 RepID=Q8DM08_THEVB|nr:hypothetical protein [Thermosynechococcus vestitus]BAC07870.1 tlr0318 [Thermosynechococcus vestitus BP-1]
MKREPPPTEDTNLVKFLQTYAGTPPPPPPDLQERIIKAAVQQHNWHKRCWRLGYFLGVGAIATTAASVWFLKPTAQVAEQRPADGLETFIASNWQDLFESAEPALFE